jgi:hypothetical protein
MLSSAFASFGVMVTPTRSRSSIVIEEC